MIYFFRFILGFVHFEFKGGFYENFLNDCFENNIDIKEICLTENGFRAMCKINTYKMLHKIAFKHAGKVKIIKKVGLPFILAPLKNRAGFFVGATAFVLLISFLSCFVWNVDVIGNERLSDTVINTYLEKNNLKVGAMWSGINRQQLCWDMMSEFDDIGWVHINKIGTTARVEINETRRTLKNTDDNDLKGINVLRRELEVVATREQSNINIKCIKEYKTLFFFGIKIPLYLKKNVGDMTEESEKMLSFNDVTLPVGYTEQTEKWFNSKKSMLTDSQLLCLAEKKLEIKENQEFDGYEIINKTVLHTIDNEKCVITANYIISKRE